MEVRYVNKQIGESEEQRLAGLETVRASLSEVEFKKFDRVSLVEFVKWYIQRSLNAQMRYGEEYVRQTMRRNDEKLGITSMELVKEIEEEAPVVELPKPRDPHEKRQAAKKFVRSSRYQSEFGTL